VSAQGSSAYTDPNTLLERHARRSPDKIFIESPDQGSRITFGQFEALTRRFANFLTAEGVRASSRISVLSDNGIEALVVFWGAPACDRESDQRRDSREAREPDPARRGAEGGLLSRELASDPRALGTGRAPWFAFA
jgi:hypothetical protein